MSNDRDSQWQQQKTDESSTYGQSGFRSSSSLDSRSGLDKRQQRDTVRTRHYHHGSRKPSWLLGVVLMLVVVGVAMLKIINLVT